MPFKIVVVLPIDTCMAVLWLNTHCCIPVCIYALLHAGRAAEELVYGPDEMSTLNQRRIVTARRIVQKLTVASAMVDNSAIGPRTISTPTEIHGGQLLQIVDDRVRAFCFVS